MEVEHQTNARLTAPELAGLWTQFMNDTMAICFNKYVLVTVEDPEIKSIFETALKLSQSHVETITEFFKQEKYPMPQGFTEQDVNLEAPRLYMDTFFLNYIYIMTIHGLTGYSVALGVSSRVDVRKYFSQCNIESIELYNTIMDVMLSKGLYTRPPYIHPPEIAGLAERQNFLTGWFGDRRPLTAIEISNITFNMNKTYLSKALTLGFSQVANNQEVREYFERGMKISSKHTEVFSSIFSEDNLNFPISWDSMVTNSTNTPFSDKLMMFHIGFLTSSAVAFYGAGLASSLRRDLATHYTRLTAELMKYGEDGTNIVIQNGWLEKPPTADDRMALSKGKKK
jgi:spore coat protein CotF